MKVYLLFVIILILQVFSANAQEIIIPPVKNKTPFISGEILNYQIRYGLITAGIARLLLTEAEFNNKTVFHSQTIGQTTGIAEKLYGVNDIYESWFDKKSNLPYKQIRNIKEGSYTRYNEVTYNRKNNSVNSKLSGKHDVPDNILDLSSALYYIRRIDFSKLQENDVVFINMYFSDEIFPFHFIFKGEEIIKTKFGRINCIKINPVVEVGRIFKKSNDLTIWFTNDDNFIPILIKMDIRIVGAVNIKLISYENIVNPILFLE